MDCCIEFVKNKEGGEELSPEENSRYVAMLKKKLRQAGLWGGARNPLELKPPLIITRDEVDEIVSGVDKVIGEIERELASG